MLKIELFFIASSFLLSLILIKIAIPFFIKIGFKSKINPIVQNHVREVAYGGGIVSGLVIIIYAIYINVNDSLPIHFFAAAIPIFIIGTFDDIKNFSPVIKFTLQTASALIFLLVFDPPLVYYPIILLFLISVQNSWNLIDIMDGLTGIISVIVFLTIGIVLILQGKNFSSIAEICFIIAASTFGFCFWNFHPAKIFLGDAGSMLLGMLWGVIIIEIMIADLITGVLLLPTGMIPFFEMLFLIYVRTKKGIPFYEGSPDHFALRLLNNGFEVNKIIKIVLMISAAVSILIILIAIIGVDWYKISLFAIVLIISSFIAFKYLIKLKVYEIKK